MQENSTSDLHSKYSFLPAFHPLELWTGSSQRSQRADHQRLQVIGEHSLPTVLRASAVQLCVKFLVINKT